MEMKSIPTLLFFLFLLSSCKRAETFVPRAEAEATETMLRAKIDESQRKITWRDADLKRLTDDIDQLDTTHRDVIRMINKRLEKLESESASAQEILDKVSLESETFWKELEEENRRRAKGEFVPANRCGNGPWEEWPKITAEANKTIASKAAAVAELKAVLDLLTPSAEKRSAEK